MGGSRRGFGVLRWVCVVGIVVFVRVEVFDQPVHAGAAGAHRDVSRQGDSGEMGGIKIFKKTILLFLKINFKNWFSTKKVVFKV